MSIFPLISDFSTVMVLIRPSPDSRSLVMVAVKYVFCMSKRSLSFFYVICKVQKIRRNLYILWKELMVMVFPVLNCTAVRS